MTSTTKFPLGIYVGNPNGNDATANASFESQYNAFVSDMGGAKPLFMDAFVDFTQDPSQWASNASWTAWSWAQTGSAYVGPGSGITPVVGVPLASNAGGWGNVDTFYQQIISGQYDSDYKGIVDAWANQGYKTVQFRLGYEFDGNFMPWSPGNSSSPTANADFIAAFQHVANLVHSQSTADGITGQVVWNPADINWSATAPAALYPGNQYVDIISTDSYSPLYPNDTTSWSTNSTTQLTAAQFAANATDESHFWQYTNASQYNPTPGLTAAGWSFQDAVNLALQTGKPLSISETGQGPSPSSTLEAADDPAFANWLSSALSQAQAQGVKINNVNIWDVNVGDGSWSFTDGSKPLAAAAWGADFGASSGGSAATTSTAPLSTSSTATTAAATPVATTPAPAATPQPVTIGSGPNSLVLQVSEDAWQGDAQFTISVDGTQIGGTQTVTASHAAGQTETFTVLGTFATGNHTASINFLNDAYGGSAATDRNLYVNSATINGNAVSGAALTELSNGPQSFAFQQATPVTVGSGPNSLVLQVSEDAWQGDAQFTISVDGTQVGGTQTVTASHAAGQTEAFTVLGNFSTGNHTASINFVNDAYGGSAATDRNLYVNSATINGSTVSGAALTELSNGPQSLTFQQAAPPAVTVGSGPNSLVLQVSEDAWQGDAQFTISVDGAQVGGTQTVTASHAAGQTEAFTVLGTFAAGNHTASINFVNDAYGGSASTDRNLYVNSATINGSTVSGAALTELSTGAQGFTFQQAAAVTTSATATPAPVTVGSGPNSLVLQVSEDAWQGDAQFTISVDGTQIGGTQTVTASHAAGQTETFTVLGTFATGNHTASINFLNDAYGGSAATDRNLYVNSATINGNTVSGAALTELNTGAQGFTFQQAAASAPPSVVFTDSAGHTLTQGTITTGTLDSGAWQTGMNNNLHQNATTGVDVVSTESWGYVTTAQLTDLAGHSYAMQNFVEDDVHLGGGPTGSGQAASLALTTAERGTVQIDSGNYNVNVTAVSNTATPSANTFAITFGSGADTLSLTGGSGNTVATVHAGSGTDTISFAATNSTTVTGGSGTATVNEAGGANTVIAGTGTLNVHDGSGHDLLVFHAGGGLINATGFSAANGDTLQIDASLQSSMHQTTSSAGTMISFGNNTASGIMLQGVSSLSSSAIHFA